MTVMPAGHVVERTPRISATRLLLAIAIAALTPCRPLARQVPAPWFGSWKLNLAKSTYTPGPPPYKRATYTIEPWGDDGLKVTYDMVHPRGGTSHFEWTGKLDGRDYPVQGFEEVVTYAYTPKGDGSYEVIVRFDARLAATSKVTLSSDGKTMITTTSGKSPSGQAVTTTTVYEKQ